MSSAEKGRKKTNTQAGRKLVSRRTCAQGLGRVGQNSSAQCTHSGPKAMRNRRRDVREGGAMVGWEMRCSSARNCSLGLRLIQDIGWAACDYQLTYQLRDAPSVHIIPAGRGVGYRGSAGGPARGRGSPCQSWPATAASTPQRLVDGAPRWRARREPGSLAARNRQAEAFDQRNCKFWCFWLTAIQKPNETCRICLCWAEKR